MRSTTPSTEGTEELNGRGSSAGTSEESDAGATSYGLDKKGIRSAIKEKVRDIHECYEAWLEQNPRLSGSMMVAFEISPDDAGNGAVTHIEVIDGGVGQPFMEGCVLNVFQDMRFEEPPGGGRVRVLYPLYFQPRGDDGGP